MVDQELLDIKHVEFMGSELVAVRTSDGEIYTVVKWMCEAIGFSKNQFRNERIRFQHDAVLAEVTTTLPLPTSGGVQNVICIKVCYIAFWLAKVNITPKLRAERPEFVSRLLAYQMQVEDVLAKAFVSKFSESSVAESACRMSDLELIQVISKTPQANMRTVFGVLRHKGYDIPDYESVMPSHESGVANDRPMMELFISDILPRCTWDLLPYAFLYDLYKAWMPRVYPDEQLLGRNAFIKLLRYVIQYDSHCEFEAAAGAQHPLNRMNKPEPLVLEYELSEWKKFVPKASYKGLVRTQ